MTLSTILSRAQRGVEAPVVQVEVHLSGGLPAFTIVGLPETAVKESRERVRSALLNSHFEFPSRHITVNLAPADLPKHGGRFDLPIALGILAASGQIPQKATSGLEFIGELALDGALRPVSGEVGAAIAASQCRRTLVMPATNAANAALVPKVKILPVARILDLCAHLHGRERISFANPPAQLPSQYYPDLADVRGQPLGKRALEIAAAGGHHLLFCGPPGTGKTMLSSRLPGILPPLKATELLEIMTLRSVTNASLAQAECWQRPFRAPHHSASATALVGGGGNPMPGEISLAHHGVLFLDELPEFPRGVLDALRQPLESGTVSLSRARVQATYPARFQLVAAMNPCPCGYAGDPDHECRCSPDQIQRYQQRVSGPLLDRIDIQVNLPRLPTKLLLEERENSENSDQVRRRVIGARQLQWERSGMINSQLDNLQLKTHCRLGTPERKLLEKAVDQLGLSVRAYHRILRLCRSIADLDGSVHIEHRHLVEALGYRQLKLLEQHG